MEKMPPLSSVFCVVQWTARSLGERFIRKYYKICLGSPLLAQNGNAISDGGVSVPGVAGASVIVSG